MCKYCCKNACQIVIAIRLDASVFHMHFACFDIFHSHFPAVLCCPFWNVLLFYSLYHLFFFIACSKRWMSHTNDHTKCTHILLRIKTRLLLSIFSICFELFTGWMGLCCRIYSMHLWWMTKKRWVWHRRFTFRHSNTEHLICLFLII